MTTESERKGKRPERVRRRGEGSAPNQRKRHPARTGDRRRDRRMPSRGRTDRGTREGRSRQETYKNCTTCNKALNVKSMVRHEREIHKTRPQESKKNPRRQEKEEARSSQTSGRRLRREDRLEEWKEDRQREQVRRKCTECGKCLNIKSMA